MGSQSQTRLSPVSAVKIKWFPPCVLCSHPSRGYSFWVSQKQTHYLQMDTANVCAQPPSGWCTRVPQGYSSITRQKKQGSRDLVFAISICKTAVLKGGEEEAGKVPLAVVGLSIGFNLIQDVTVEEEESIMAAIQCLVVLGLCFLQVHPVVNCKLVLRHFSKWINELQVLSWNCCSMVLLDPKGEGWCYYTAELLHCILHPLWGLTND